MSTNFKVWDDFLEWNVGGIINPQFAPVDELPALVAAANLQFISHLVAAQTDLAVAERQSRALDVLSQESVKAVGENYAYQLASSESRRRMLHKRVPDGLCVAILVSAQMVNPFDPYFIKVTKVQQKQAVRGLAADLGVPESWAVSTLDAVKMATPRKEINPLGVMVTIVGLGIIAITGPLAVALAPAGLAGGAAFLAGLAALGPGGIAGGIGVIGAVAAVGGGAAVAGALSMGSVQQVEQRLVTLHANAITKRQLRPGTQVLELEVIQQMEVEVEADITRREGIDDPNSPGLKEAVSKLKVIRSTLKRMKKELFNDD